MILESQSLPAASLTVGAKLYVAPKPLADFGESGLPVNTGIAVDVIHRAGQRVDDAYGSISHFFGRWAETDIHN